MAVQKLGKETLIATVLNGIRMFEESKNPLFLWGALAFLLRENSEEITDGIHPLTISKSISIPPEIAAYLLRVSLEIDALTNMPPDFAANNLLSALELGKGQGETAFTRLQTIREEACEANISDRHRALGLTVAQDLWLLEQMKVGKPVSERQRKRRLQYGRLALAGKPVPPTRRSRKKGSASLPDDDSN
ncbi:MULTISPECIES: hypothetical protein [Gluconobacter]|uniref:hypothetical protein n=1 Tax=Gluconobacter TaxID=441 RepID=UPI0039ECB61E